MSLIEITQAVVAITVIILVLLQNRSSGAGGAFGGGGGGGGDFLKQRRGMEKYLFIGTVILVAIFALLSVLNLIL